MNWQRVAHVLDEAIATVADQELNRLSEGLNDFQVAEQIAKALDSLRELQGADPPNYNNEWVALFYLTWYQPRQINTALTVLRQLYADPRNERLRMGHPLVIIDVGCGALAVQIAAAIMTAEYQREDNKVSVQGIDPSEPMKEIGVNLWLEFWTIADRYPSLSYLSSACDVITSTCSLFDSHISYYRSEVASPDSECWLMAVHTVYESNKQSIKDTLQTIRTMSDPSVILVTTHDFKRDIARFAVGENFKIHELRSEELLLQGNLPETTEWRKRLLDRLPEGSLGSKDWYLNNSVQWNPSNNHTVVLSKGV